MFICLLPQPHFKVFYYCIIWILDATVPQSSSFISTILSRLHYPLMTWKSIYYLFWNYSSFKKCKMTPTETLWHRKYFYFPTITSYIYILKLYNYFSKAAKKNLFLPLAIFFKKNYAITNYATIIPAFSLGHYLSQQLTNTQAIKRRNL